MPTNQRIREWCLRAYREALKEGFTDDEAWKIAENMTRRKFGRLPEPEE